MSTAVARVPWLCRWVAVIALAVGVVGMHHVVGAHARPGDSGHGAAGMTMPVTQVDSYCCAAPVAVAVARPAIPGAGGGLMLHPCLAVLTALILLAALILTRRLAQACGLGPSGLGSGGQRASQQRAPPLPLRLAQLGVLRL